MSFTCNTCGRKLPNVELSQIAIDLADADSPAQAVAVLDPDDLTCQDCEGTYDTDNVSDLDDDLDEIYTEDGEVGCYLFIDGVETYLSPAQLVAHQQSY